MRNIELWDVVNKEFLRLKNNILKARPSKEDLAGIFRFKEVRVFNVCGVNSIFVVGC